MVRQLAASIGVLSSLVGLACTGGGSGSGSEASASRDTTTSLETTTTRAPRPFVVLRVGMCFDTLEMTSAAAITRDDIVPVDCAPPHHFELFATLVYPAANDAPFPRPEALLAHTSDQCLLRFENYVGQGYEESSLDIAAVQPDERGWLSGDRELACAVFRADFEPLVGSVAQTGA